MRSIYADIQNKLIGLVWAAFTRARNKRARVTRLNSEVELSFGLVTLMWPEY